VIATVAGRQQAGSLPIFWTNGAVAICHGVSKRRYGMVEGWGGGIRSAGRV
jgi:hypothetical protein